MRFLLILIMAWGGWSFRASAEVLLTLRAESFRLEIDAKGTFSALTLLGSDQNYLAMGQASSVLSLQVDGRLQAPDRARWDRGTERLTLYYGDAGASAILTAVAKPTHVVLELMEVSSPRPVELVVWGPYATTIGETIGEIVGVVRDRKVAVGIQSLNPKTIGGFPARDNDARTEHSGDDTGYYPHLPASLKLGQGFRGDTARSAPFGSVLQAYCRDRGRERMISNWGHERYRVPALADGGVVGSRIALFACPEPKALEVIGSIELAENLPHPMIDGIWDKQSRASTASYLIVDFGEGNVDRAIEMTRRAGLRYLYHSSPFASWGRFKLKPELFPHGWEGLKACAEKARAAGVRIGFHTLSNFITPSDPLVTPEPDPRLASIGSSELTEDLGVDATQVPLGNPDLFRRSSVLNTVRVGKELIRFGSLSSGVPWRLLDCQRGAWGTRAEPHSRGERVERLLDHDYKVFFGDAGLSVEIARQIAALGNLTGARQLSFDGLEGNWASGHGDYGIALFTKAWYDALDPALRGQVINDASMPCHFNWHINTRMNWGEPWYAGFRDSQTLYRFKNQVLFERNLMPHMLGWFALRASTSLEDAEWLLARAAGFDAGFALATSLASTAQLAADPLSAETARQFGASGAIFEIIRQWETARMSGAFSPEVKALLRDNAREFQLRQTGEGAWKLAEAHLARFTQTSGSPEGGEFQFENPAAPQPLQWMVQSVGKTPLAGIRVELNGRLLVDLKDRVLPAGGNLRSSGNGECVITDGSWKELDRVPMVAEAEQVPRGPARFKLRAALPEASKLKIEVRTLGAGIPLRASLPVSR